MYEEKKSNCLFQGRVSLHCFSVGSRFARSLGSQPRCWSRRHTLGQISTRRSSSNSRQSKRHRWIGLAWRNGRSRVWQQQQHSRIELLLLFSEHVAATVKREFIEEAMNSTPHGAEQIEELFANPVSVTNIFTSHQFVGGMIVLDFPRLHRWSKKYR